MKNWNKSKNIQDFAKEVLDLDDFSIWLGNYRYELVQLIILTRTKKGISQKELAAKLNTTQSVISRMESGPMKSLSLEYLFKILSILGVPPEKFLRRVG